MIFIFIKINIRKNPNWDKNKSYIYIGNHGSYLDAPAVILSTPTIFKPLGKIEMAKFPVFGWIYKKMVIMVDRKDKESRAASVAALKAELNAGMSILLFPEGTMNTSELMLKDFYDGAFKISIETQTQNLQIQDADGFDRFKNGFIVDNFTGHGIGDVGNLDYRIAMDMASGEARPICKTNSVQLIEADDDGTAVLSTDRVDNNYAKTGDLITLPYSEETLIDQPFASKFLNVNPFNVFTWVGTVELDPAGDEWKETERVPELVVNQQGMFDTMAANLGNPNLAEIQLGTVWNEWQDNWVGAPVEVGTRNIGGQRREQTFARGVPRRVLQTQEITTVQQVNQTRTGVRSVFVPQVIRRSMGDRVLNVAFIPFIRSRTVNFTGTRFKPNTRVYPFFNGVDLGNQEIRFLGFLGKPKHRRVKSQPTTGIGIIEILFGWADHV